MIATLIYVITCNYLFFLLTSLELSFLPETNYEEFSKFQVS